MMHPKIIFSCAAFIGFSAFGQNLELVSSAGTYTESSGGSVAWSVGEVVIETVGSGSYDYTQGFHQGNIYVASIEPAPEFEFKVYPNPAADIVYINTDQTLDLVITDVSGRVVAEYSITSGTFELNVTEYSRGTYNLSFTSSSGQMLSSRIVVM